MNFFTCTFQGVCLPFRKTYLKEHLEWLLLFISIEKLHKAVQFSCKKYYSREYLSVEITHSKLFQGGYLFRGGSTYLLINKYWGVVIFQQIITGGYFSPWSTY